MNAHSIQKYTNYMKIERKTEFFIEQNAKRKLIQTISSTYINKLNPIGVVPYSCGFSNREFGPNDLNT